MVTCLSTPKQRRLLWVMVMVRVVMMVRAMVMVRVIVIAMVRVVAAIRARTRVVGGGMSGGVGGGVLLPARLEHLALLRLLHGHDDSICVVCWRGDGGVLEGC